MRGSEAEGELFSEAELCGEGLKRGGKGVSNQGLWLALGLDLTGGRTYWLRVAQEEVGREGERFLGSAEVFEARE